MRMKSLIFCLKIESLSFNTKQINKKCIGLYIHEVYEFHKIVNYDLLIIEIFFNCLSELISVYIYKKPK